jgi:hypothetical protein
VVSTPNAVEERIEPDRPAPRRNWLVRRWAAVRATGEAGMSTAEYAVGTVVICRYPQVCRH